MKKKEIRSTVKTVYRELWDLLSLYEVTERCNETPGQEMDGDIPDYVERQIADIRKTVNVLLLGEKKAAKALMQIIDETAYFVRQCEVPGVVTRWKQVNPRLIYFDCAFDLMEKCPQEYDAMRRGLTEVRLSCYPDAHLLAERNAYFEQSQKRYKHENREYSENGLFQEELQHTLTLLFEQTFEEYL